MHLIDLEGNDLNNVSHAFGELKELKYLYLPNNNISELSEQVTTKSRLYQHPTYGRTQFHCSPTGRCSPACARPCGP